MALHICNQAKKFHLDLVLAIGYTLRLYKTDVTAGLTPAQIDALTEASFTEATFTGYSSKALTGGSWTTVAGDPGTATYAQQTFTSTANQTAQPIYGYYITRTSDGKLEWFEKFTGPVSISLNGDTIQITPTLNYNDDEEATVAARGLVGTPFISTSNSANYTSNVTTDFACNGVAVDSTRVYRAHINTVTVANADATWFFYFQVNGAFYARMGVLRIDPGVGVIGTDHMNCSTLWFPSSGTYNLTVGLQEFSGSATIHFEAAADTPRQFWIEDAGAR
jgi:hypothetical protein